MVGSSETAAPPTGLIQDLWVHAALPMEVSVPLIRAAVGDLRVGGCETITAIAPLPGLCGWIVRGRRWETLDPTAPEYSDEQSGAVEACARGRPRPGHSILGGGTYSAARPAIEALALEYSRRLKYPPGVLEALKVRYPLEYAAAPHSIAEERACDTLAAAYRGAGGEVAAVLYMHDTSPEAVADSVGCYAVLTF